MCDLYNKAGAGSFWSMGAMKALKSSFGGSLHENAAPQSSENFNKLVFNYKTAV